MAAAGASRSVCLLLAALAQACSAKADKTRHHADDDVVVEVPASPSASVRSRKAECVEIVATINKNSGAIKDFDTKKDLEEQANKLESFDRRIGDMDITDAELKKRVAEYRKMVTDMAKLVRDLKDPSDIDGLEKRSNEIGKRESDIVDAVNKYCGL